MFLLNKFNFQGDQGPPGIPGLKGVKLYAEGPTELKVRPDLQE